MAEGGLAPLLLRLRTRPEVLVKAGLSALMTKRLCFTIHKHYFLKRG